MLDVQEVRRDFPILSREMHDKPLVYLDNAATSQKPLAVLDTVRRFYETQNSNIHRTAYDLSSRAEEAYEAARETARAFINAGSSREIIFTSGATESINMVARCFGTMALHEGDEIITTVMEHHSNLIPWQVLCREKGAVLKHLSVTHNGELCLESLDKLLSPKTKLMAVTQVSNVLGVINPVKKIIQCAHDFGVPVLIDGAQGAPHLKVDMKALGCDFYVFSGHKLYAENGIGVLYAREKWLEQMKPWCYGGGMVGGVSLTDASYGDLPFKFEAGTRNIAAAVSLGAAVRYIQELGMDNIAGHENSILHRATQALNGLEGVTTYGGSGPKCSILAFNLDNCNPFDAASIYDKLGIAVRSGNHCAEPLMKWMGLPGVLRASFGLYNTMEEVETLVRATKRVQGMLA